MYGKMQESGVIEIIPFVCTSALWGQFPVFLHPESPQGAQLGTAAVAEGLVAATSYVNRVENQWLEGRDTALFFFFPCSRLILEFIPA